MPQAERLIQTYDIAKEAVVLGGLSRHAAARRFGVSIASAVRWVTRLRCCTKFNTVFKGNRRMANPG